MIKYIFSKPHFLFWTMILLILVYGFIDTKQTLSFNIHDTYFVISRLDLSVILSVFYGFLSLVYFTLIKLDFTFIKWMTLSHVFISIIGLVLIWILLHLIKETKPTEFNSLISDMLFNEKVTLCVWISVFLIIASHVLFIINAIYALIRGRI